MNTRLHRWPILVAAGAVLVLTLAAAGCGGDSSSGDTTHTTATTTATTATTTSDSTTEPGGINADPATAILKAAGLEVCSQSQLASTIIVTPGFTGARSFLAAPDCSKKGPRTTIVAATFSTPEAVAKGKKEMQKLYPKSVVTTYRTIVISVSGQNAQEISDKITEQLAGPSSTGG